ncbi:Alpha-1,3/1,6-mannosyltransferase ALG2 [Trichinella nelsoni]|uniref:Alpha-1,3/1,6-mannosyltransferase ALG2 n=1 Tax=Trichinella nelsoni TaxID=6336 RepID=A0A0V0S546_9BILA|nr:Alpha-1,3/1,6-mannosyltransferase ALG2 [Trichinella nelsoni]
MRVLVCHPEFWFGGAESVVFDAIQAFNGRNYSVYLVTGHCDSYWLDKLKNSVTEMLYGSVTMCGDWFHGMHFLAFRAWLKWGRIFDIVMLDGCPGAAPLLKLLFGKKIFYYCHFPYQLMLPNRRLIEKVFYFEMWLLERWCIKFCDVISTNSKFTCTVLQLRDCFEKLVFLMIKQEATLHNVNRCFPWISNRICSVHYPAIPIVTTQCSDAAKFEYCKTLPTNYFLSLNRYWPEKRVDIAIEAFSMLKRKISNDVWKSVNLIIAGSVEERIDASVNCRDELIKLTKLKNIEDKVIFLQNVSSEEKVQLLSRCTGVVYTPPMEHFGITPLEGSYFGKIIIAATGCGTNETVENGKTGILVDFGAENFSDAMAKVLALNSAERDQYGQNGKIMIEKKFSQRIFSEILLKKIIIIS